MIRKGLIAGALLALSVSTASAQEASKPNILVIWGDDIGTWNISHNNRGMMGYQTPNIDRIADEGLCFTDYYAQQSCTAGRAAFIGGNVPVRTGMTKVGLPGAAQGWQKTDVTMATVLKSSGYATGQFGKNHQGDRDEHLPTMHGFDEFFGNLYHLNAEEEPENRDYPGHGTGNGKTSSSKFGPRGVIHSWANADGTQKIENTGPLTRKRMETIDDETVAAAKHFITDAVKAGQAVLRLVERHAHALPHPCQGGAHAASPAEGDEYQRRHGRARHACRRAAEAARRSRHRRQHGGDVLDRQRPALQHLAGCRHDAVPQREELELGRRLPRAGLRALARPFPGRQDAERHRRA